MGKDKDKDKKKDELPQTFGFLGSSVASKQPQQQTKSNVFMFGTSSAMQASADKSSAARQKDAAVFTAGTGGKVIQFNKTWTEILADTQHYTPLPYSHGIELELIVCDNSGAYLEGDNMVRIMTEMVKDAQKVISDIINVQRQDFPPIPEIFRKKIKKMPYIRQDIEKGSCVVLEYEINNKNLQKTVAADIFGRDGNVTMSTFILELVTPPCAYAEELAYWAGTLFNVSKTVLPRDLHIMSSAINPTMKEYVRGLSHSDHSHIGSFVNDQEKVQAFDMIRNFIPHIVALSVNSPIINNVPTDVIKTKDENGKPRYVAPGCIRSIRLFNNTTMLSNSNEPSKYLPYLAKGDDNDKNYLLQTLQKASLADARFQDIFPFTKYGTMEVRIMDAQISICRRIGLALLLEAMCYKARKLLSMKKWVPNVNSETICINRRSAIERGLIGVFKPVNMDYNSLAQQDPFFAECYLGTNENPNRFMFQAVQGMFKYLKDVLVELGYLYSPFVKPILQSVFGDITYAAVPMAEAEYQLCLYDYKLKQGQQPNVLQDLIYFTMEYCKDPIQNPLTGELTLPTYMTK